MEQENPQLTTSGAQPDSSSPKNKKRRLIIVIITSLIVIVAAIIAVVAFNAARKTESNQQQTVKPLTIGEQPYIYPCSVATREDYARIFKLDDENVGTVTERSALPAEYLKQGGDLTKLAPGVSSDPRYSTDCSYTLAKKGASQVNRIDIEVLQFASDKEAKDEFGSARDRAAGLFLSGGNKAKLPALPSFTTNNSYVKTPDADDMAETVGLLVGSRLIEMEYRLIRTDAAEVITPLLDAYAKTIKAKLDAGGKSEPNDLTGRDTFVDVKFVDICRRTDLSRLAGIFSGIEFRPDEVTDIGTYGSLLGSRAAADGAESDCMLAFNTEKDREAITKLDEKPKTSRFDDPISSSARWQHKMTLAVNTFKSPNEAKAALSSKKTSAKKPFAGANSIVKDMDGLGDGAYKLTREVDNSLGRVGGGTDVRTSTETSLVVVRGKDLIVVSLQQLSVNDDYQTTPTEVNDDQLEQAYRLVQETVAQNRS